MNTSAAGIALIQRFEGCKLESYPDPGTGGDPWTIGYGHTGAEVVRGMRIPQETADAWLAADLVRFERCVEDAASVPLTQAQFDALVSLAFNIGCGALRGSTLIKRLNEADYAAAAEQFGRWNKAGGKEMAGLTRRRAAERELFLEG